MSPHDTSTARALASTDSRHPTVVHPCRWTPAILVAVEPHVARLALPVYDPFAGTGERLGALCNRLGLPFTGTEIEPEFIADPRVHSGDSTDAGTYPAGPHLVVTSPVYPNGMTDHFHARDGSRRHTYRQALAENLGHDRPLHPHNMGRWGNAVRRSPHSEVTHWSIAADCVRHWPAHALVDVKDTWARGVLVPVVDRWAELLGAAGYTIAGRIVVTAPGQRHGANGHARADTETILVAHRNGESGR